jgi:DNA-binding transcriptional LysR family regulator
LLLDCLQQRLVVSTAEAAIDAAIAGVGVTCALSYQLERALREGHLVLLLEPFEPTAVPVSFLYPKQERVPLKLRALLDFAAPHLRARLRNSGSSMQS